MRGKRKKGRKSKRSSNVEWCTPPVYLDAVEALAPIGFDPCWNNNSLIVPEIVWTIHPGPIGLPGLACRTLLQVDDSRKYPWPRTSGGLTFVNPPYGRHLKSWAAKISEETTGGRELIALVPASTGAQWFKTLIARASCLHFPTGRHKFIGAGDMNPAFDVCFVYFGARPSAFELAFRRLPGWCVQNPVTSAAILASKSCVYEKGY